MNFDGRPLPANMSETVTPRKFSVEGEAGSESDEGIGAGLGWPGDRGGGEGDAASHLTTWRAARERGELAGAPKRRGPARRVVDPRDKKLAEQAREISRWQKRAERAEALVELQKQVAALLGAPLTTEPS